MPREDLVVRWFDLTREVMPAQAQERGWPVCNDHCFQRILLDNATGAPWRTRIAAPAWRHAPDAVLAEAVRLAEAALAGTADLHALNFASLRWRGKERR